MHYTLIQSQYPNRLTKHFTLAPDGTLHKETSAYLSEGTAIVQTADNITDFANRLPTLQTNEALIFGIPNDHRVAPVVSQKNWDPLSEVEKTKSITRTNQHFSYPDGQAILMFDVDADDTRPPPTPEEFVRELQRLSPEFENVQLAVIPSASSYIYNTETDKELTGGSGFRVYTPIDRGVEIPRVAKALHKRFIAAGLGFAAISKDGRIRIKSPIDMSVYTAVHLDFAAGASTGEGLDQRRGAPQIYNENGTQLIASSVVLSPETEAEAKQAEKNFARTRDRKQRQSEDRLDRNPIPTRCAKVLPTLRHTKPWPGPRQVSYPEILSCE